MISRYLPFHAPHSRDRELVSIKSDRPITDINTTSPLLRPLYFPTAKSFNILTSFLFNYRNNDHRDHSVRTESFADGQDILCTDRFYELQSSRVTVHSGTQLRLNTTEVEARSIIIFTEIIGIKISLKL